MRDPFESPNADLRADWERAERKSAGIDGTAVYAARKGGQVPPRFTCDEIWLGWQDSNLRMAASKAAALPLGDTPINASLILAGRW